jgi:hypothetical protein
MSGPIISKENDLKILSKIIECLVEERELERSRTFLEIKDATGRAFRYVSMKDRAYENSGNSEQSSRMDNVFRRMVERSSDKGTPGTRLHGHIKDDEDSQDEGGEECSSLDD